MKKLLTLFIVLYVLLISGCFSPTANSNQDNTSTEEVSTTHKKSQWSNWVHSYSKGRISKDSSIIINFNNSIIDEKLINSSASKLFNITPTVSGKAIFKSTQQIIFTPDVLLASGTTYQIELKGNESLIPKIEDTFKFKVQTIPMEYQVTVDKIRVDSQDSSLMTLSGTAIFSDIIKMDKIKSILTARLQDKDLAVKWSGTGANSKFHFSISNIKRDTFATDLTLKWDGQSIGIKNTGNLEIAIPPTTEFKIIDAKLVTPDSAKPYIQITLSDLHDRQQQIDGLIALERIPDKDNTNSNTIKFEHKIEGNIIKLYPLKVTTGKFNLSINKALKSKTGHKLAKVFNQTITILDQKPSVHFVGKGQILPHNKKLTIPFEAVNINAVTVTAFLIKDQNMAQFLQTNGLSGENELGRVGRYLWRKIIPLNPANPAQSNRYSLDVSELIKAHPSGLFRLTLSIDRRFSTYQCEDEETTKIAIKNKPLENYEDQFVSSQSGWDGIENYYDDGSNNDSWTWADRQKPCTDSYYNYSDNPVSDSKNVIASNIGLLAKQDGHGKMLIVATNLATTEPLGGTVLSIYNFQNDLLGTATTDKEGIAHLKLDKTPFLLTAKNGSDRAFLKLNEATAQSVSHFDVGGDINKKGVKGYIYGERGVWRPGDDIHLTLVIYDKDKTIPDNHPVTLKLVDPNGLVQQTITNNTPINNFYPFKVTTDEDSPTGKWLVKAQLGGNEFTKMLNIEMVRPNRLKIDLDFGTETLYGYTTLPTGKLFAEWLHGAKASGLKAKVSVRFREKTTKFTSFSDYEFDDPTRSLDSAEKTLLEGRLDDDGYLSFDKNFTPDSKSPGMLSAWFTSRVFEQGGGFSTSKHFLDYHPYENYVGIKLPKGDASRNMLLTDEDHTVEIASVNAKGEASDLDKVQVTLYKISWKWWWDKSSDSLSAYSDANHSDKLQQSIVQTKNGRGKWKFNIKYPDWGRYLIRACDTSGGHCTGKTLYVDWPGWAGRAQEQGSSAASTLSLTTDKKEYKVGETAIIQAPKATQGRALLTIENSSEILHQQWLVFDESRQQVSLPITEKMAPNVYANITVLQPHSNRKSDRPIRMIGIVSLKVTDPNTHLKPMITADNEWKPKSKQTVKISETNGKTMTYTLALVDEGLLGLTRFKTPNLHKYFYRKEALGIKTWDLFDQVVGAYGGNIERILALGGGDAVQLDDAANKPKRFPPVVQFFGPFTLSAGESKQHDIELPPYIGAVRLMVVAGDQGSFGLAEKSIFVRDPLIVQPSLPRVLSSNEETNIPITLFSTRDDIKDVEISITTDDLINTPDGDKTTVHFEKIGDKLGFIKIKTGNKIGQSKIVVTATSGKYSSSSEIFIDIRHPNPVTHKLVSNTVDAGKETKLTIKPHGLEGTNVVNLEVSTVPPLGLHKHLDYLIKYPHGCLEQTTSAAFPQLYLSQLVDGDKKSTKQTESNVAAAIDRLKQFQTSEGDFSYWPGSNQQNVWASLYAGHFLIEAKKQGFEVNSTVMKGWLKFQAKTANNWLQGNKHYAYVQAYRLYLLSLAGKPEIGAMNRFKESNQRGQKARWLLAAAYKISGQDAAAKNIVEGLVANPESETEKNIDTFSSRLSDLGIILNALTVLEKNADAEQYIEAISSELQKSAQNTHGIAWALSAVSRHIGGKKGSGVKATLHSSTGSDETIASDKSFISRTFSGTTKELELSINNPTSKRLYTQLISSGVPAADTEQDSQQGLTLTAEYFDAKTKEKLDLNEPVTQGQDILVTLTVGQSYTDHAKNIALTYIVATGMEIHNPNVGNNKALDHQDVRDDRIHSYFSLDQDQSLKLSFIINTAYAGKAYLPAVQVQSMYQPENHAILKGQWVTVVRDKAKSAKVPVKVMDKVTTEIKKGKVTQRKVWLYNEPNADAKSSLYLIKDDSVEILKQLSSEKEGQWSLIRFHGRKTIEMWLKTEYLKAE